MKSSKKLNRSTNQNGALDKDRLHLFCSKSRKKSVARSPQGQQKMSARADVRCSGSRGLSGSIELLNPSDRHRTAGGLGRSPDPMTPLCPVCVEPMKKHGRAFKCERCRQIIIFFEVSDMSRFANERTEPEPPKKEN